jgi:hypothetical protein
MLVGAVLATALLGAASVAYAADATGKIKSLDMTKDMVTLDNGSSYMAPKSVKLSDFKVSDRQDAAIQRNDGRPVRSPQPNLRRRRYMVLMDTGRPRPSSPDCA